MLEKNIYIYFLPGTKKNIVRKVTSVKEWKKKDKRKEILKNVEKSDMRFRRRKIKEKQ